MMKSSVVTSSSIPKTAMDGTSSGTSTMNFKRSLLSRLKLQSSKLICTTISGHQTLSAAPLLATGNGDIPRKCDVTETAKRCRTTVVDHYRETQAAALPRHHRCDVTSCYDDVTPALRHRYADVIRDIDHTASGSGSRYSRRRSTRIDYTRIDIIHRTSRVLWEQSAPTAATVTSRPDVTQSDMADSFTPNRTNGILGEVKLSVTVQPQLNLINIHVSEIRDLEAKRITKDIMLEAVITKGAFHRVDQRQVSRVQVAPEDLNNNVITVEQCFAFRLNGRDEHESDKRKILLSVSSINNGRSYPIGSLSFGVAKLISKSQQRNRECVIKERFSLVSESSRKRKRLRDESCDKENYTPIPSAMKSRDRVTIVVCCNASSPDSYGFTIRHDKSDDATGALRVASVLSRGPAAEAGLLPGDQLVSVNEMDVAKCTVSSVASLIHRTVTGGGSGSVRLGVIRSKGSSEEPTKTAVGESLLLHSDTGYETQPSRNFTATSTLQLACDDDDGWRQPEVESDVSLSLLNDARLGSLVHDASDSDVINTTAITPSRDQRRMLNDVNNNDGDCVNGELTVRRHRRKVDDVTDLLTASPILCVQPEVDSSLKELISLERKFIDKMTSGIQTFSRPLRHHVIDSVDHKALFQNVEKLVALSEFHIGCLTSSSESQHLQSVIARLSVTYSARRAAFCEAYATYLGGLPTAFDILNQLEQTNAQFSAYVESVSLSRRCPSLSEFFQCPIAYLQQLAVVLRRVILVNLMPGGATDRDHLIHLELTCEDIVRTLMKFEQSPLRE